ncbi:MAG: CvpA family protein [Dehalococcoidales bacterium]|jgi:membrane protein required for colicin V production
MNWLDIVLIVVLAVFTFMGVKAGIIKILFTLVGGIVGVVLAGRFSDSLGNKMSFISNSDTAKIVAFIIILVVVMIIAVILALIFKKIAETILLGWVNRIGGGILGLLTGAIFCGALIAMWVKFHGGSVAITDSAIARFLIKEFWVVLGLLPGSFKSVKDIFQ